MIKLDGRIISLRTAAFTALVLFGFSGLSFWLLGHSNAAISGQTTLYFKKDPSDINATYNMLSLTNGDARSDVASTSTSTTNVNASPPTSFCESSGITGEIFTQISASAASTGERCIGTFISLPVGHAFTMSTSDAASIKANVYSSESSSQVTSAPRIYIYRWNGSGTTLATADRIASWTTCADPGTTPSVCTAAQTAVAPANNITFAATDRIVVILSQNVTRSHSSTFVSNYIDNSSRSPSASIVLGYDIQTPNKPTLTGSLDDDFVTAQTNTTCASTTYNSKWVCNAPSAAGGSTDINSASYTPAGGDSSGWLTLRDQCASCTVSNFGTTPSNAFIYQSLPSAYSNGNVRTVVNSSLSYQIGSGPPSTPSSPYNHVGLVLWASNTDYLELQLYSTGVRSTTNTVQVALNNSGALGTASNINTSTTLGTFGRIWLGFVNTNGSYQPQYSTDGSTWTNVGSAVTHGIFSEVGLNTFVAVPSANYSGSFDWFQSTLTSPTYSQGSYRFYSDQNGSSPLVAEHTAYTLASSGQNLHLRMLINETGQSAASADSFKMQVAPLGGVGSCSAVSSGNYTDLGTLSPTAAGPNQASTANDDGGPHSIWSNMNNALSEDGAVSNVTLSTVGINNSSDYLLTTGYGFSIPSTATISGIKVEVKASGSDTTSMDSDARLIKNGSENLVGPPTGSGPFFKTTTLTYSSWGNTTSLWSTTWTPADINASNFGVGIAAVNSAASTTTTANIDNIRITVYYTTPSGNIAYQTSGNNGFALSSSANDPTDTGQTLAPETYVESNNFSNSNAATGGTIDGEWDFNIVDSGAPSGTSYCFRAVKSDGTVFSNYTYYPQIITATSGPTTDQVMRGGTWFNSGSKQAYYWAQ